MKYELPKLKYAFSSLEPHIDTETMKIHYTKHHQTYLDKLNAIIEINTALQTESIVELLKELNSLPTDLQPTIRNAGGGFHNHNLFWESLTPAQKPISSKLSVLISQNFESFDGFTAQFTNKALALFGSGWTWLIQNRQNKFEIINTANQDNPISTIDCKVLLGLDVWEHAYYLKYQNRRAEYIQNWWNVVDWEVVENRM